MAHRDGARTTSRPKLALPSGVTLPPELAAAIGQAFHVTTYGTDPERPADAWTLLPPGPQVDAVEALASLGEGAAVIEHRGDDAPPGVAWASRRLQAAEPEVRRTFVRTCSLALEQFALAGTEFPDESREYAFAAGGKHFECLIAPARRDATGTVAAVCGVLWETTASARIQSKVDQIDQAGAALLDIRGEEIAGLNMAERLQLLEGRIDAAIREVLAFDHYEIRVIDRESARLELVFARGIQPLKIGESLEAGERGNGICGWVAATGRSYLCRNTATDPLYYDGLENAASALTVPLRLHDDVIGVFNIESREPNAFDEEDQRFAELFGRYVATAMHILDLLVVERFTTNERVSESVLSEVGPPLRDMAERLKQLRAGITDDQLARAVDDVLEVAHRVEDGLEACTSGPQRVTGTSRMTAEASDHPDIVGRRVLVADNEPVVLDAIREVLESRGAEVVTCDGGAETIDRLRAVAAGREQGYDIVVSDIRMPDRNGYEVFSAARELDEQIPVILMTGFGYDPHHSIVRASQEGLESFLFKPLEAEALVEAVAGAIRGDGAASA